MATPFRLIIEGRADDLFIPDLIKSAMNLAPSDGAIRFEYGTKPITWDEAD